MIKLNWFSLMKISITSFLLSNFVSTYINIVFLKRLPTYELFTL